LTLAGGDTKKMRRKDRFVLLALKAAEEAVASSGLDYKNWADPFRVATVVGSGIGGLTTIENEHDTFRERGPSRVSPFLVPKMIVDSAAGDISIVYGAKGPNYSITTACATGSHCIGAGFNHVRSGLCDIAIVGGAEAPITNLGMSGFNSIGALSTRNDSPATASRPFDKDRDGFVIAEGAGILILEEYEHAKKRGATIVGEICGYGLTGDAFHETAPDPTGAAGAACMRMALKDAKINPEQIGYINAHGTSTKFNDSIESTIIKQVFGRHALPATAGHLAVSSTKSMTGHTLGAAGGIEAITSILALRDGILPPTINYTTPDPECDLDYIPNVMRQAKPEYALSNNLGFGGHNASLIFKRFAG
jgi:3-oxoacyl-[acyl-carrier-protein] synthase II